jgi:holo-[acyl-carrier protein] synthase
MSTRLSDYQTGVGVADSTAPPLVGIDLVEPERLRERLARTAGLELELFHEGELNYCKRQDDPIQHLAARFAAKEAVIKALGIDGWEPLEVEVVGGGEQTSVLLHGDVAQRAAALGVEVTISLTHLPAIAGAVALATPPASKPR